LQAADAPDYFLLLKARNIKYIGQLFTLHARMVCGKRLRKARVSVCPSVRLSVPSIERGSDVRLVCDSSGAGDRYWPIAGTVELVTTP